MRAPSFITPNTLTVTRIALIPLGVYVLFLDGGDNPKYQALAWTVFFILGLTDILDGRWARNSNRITAFGTFLDPVADKVAIGAAMVGLSMQGKLWWWVTILILVREVSVTILRLTVIKEGVIPASKGGKLKAAFQGFGVGFYILPLPTWLHIPRDAFMAVAIYLTIKTGYDYFKNVIKK